jgi:hypothetical protein
MGRWIGPGPVGEDEDGLRRLSADAAVPSTTRVKLPIATTTRGRRKGDGSGRIQRVLVGVRGVRRDQALAPPVRLTSSVRAEMTS